jgi:hypothetical protein
LVVTAASVSWPALACVAPDAEKYVFLPSLPAEIPPGAAVLVVSPLPSEGLGANMTRVQVERVVIGNLARRELDVRLGRTSCSRSQFLTEPAYLVGHLSELSDDFFAVEFRLSELQDLQLGEDDSIVVPRILQ